MAAFYYNGEASLVGDVLSDWIISVWNFGMQIIMVFIPE
jgi:hypothetical protein